MQTHTNKRMYKVMTPIEKKDGGTFWMRVGTGFPGKDPTTINIRLDALPAGDKPMLHLREMDEEDFQRRDGNRANGERRAPAAAATKTDDLPF